MEILILLLLCIFVAKLSIFIVPARAAYVHERLGKFHRVLKPGLHFLVPIIDRIAYRHEMREQLLEVPSQSCITKDNIQIDVDGLVYIKVMDAQKASYGIGDYRVAAVNLAQTTLRSELGKMALHDIFSEREALNATVVQEIDKASDPWGVKVLRYEIMNIEPSKHVVHTLEKQMEAERERRAQVTIAMAEKEAVSIVSEGKRQEMINLSEGKRTEQINEAEGQAREISILADATAYGAQRVATAIAQPGGDQAMRMRIVERYIGDVGDILKHSNVSVVPNELANIKGVFEGISRVSTNLNGSANAHRSNGVSTSPTLARRNNRMTSTANRD